MRSGDEQPRIEEQRPGFATMLEPDEAVARVISALIPLDIIERELGEADGHVLAETVRSPVSLPLWSNSAMDGYACLQSDIQHAEQAAPVRLRVIEQVRAGGFPSLTIKPGEATRISTGAPVPDGADTVVRVEDTDAGSEFVQIRDSRDAGRNVRAAGEDVREGDLVLGPGTTLTPPRIAFLAAVGVAVARVHRRPRVAIIATGDELVRLEQFDEVLAGRRIVSSNSYGLVAAVRSAGGIPVDFGIVPDTAEALREVMRRALDCDLILTTAGVSMGEADHVKPVMEALGGSIHFWRVRMRPGSPIAFGTVGGKPWLGLPGNPVSTMVTFELFARPAIRGLMGDSCPVPHRVPVVVDEAMSIAGPMTHFARVKLSHSPSGVPDLLPRARPAGPQGSNILSSLAAADALMIVPPGTLRCEVGEVFEAIPLPGWH